MDFHLQSRRLVLYEWEKILQDECCWLVPNLILSIVCGHALFLFLVVLFLLECFYLKKKIQKHWKIFKDKNILFWVLFYFSWGLHELWYLSWFRTCLTLWRNLDSMCYINAKLFLILCEYVLVCTCTQGLIKKLIFLVYVPSIA